ncbi:MAG TPA: hypothetical protein VIJ24_05690 [Verrucomicrobiae bacterium]
MGGVGGRRGGGLERGAIVGEDGGIEGVVFGTLALGASEVPDLSGVEPAHGLGGDVAGGEQSLFITASGFTNDLHLADGLHLLQQLGAAFWGIIQAVLAAVEMELEGGLGDIHSGIDGR